MIYVLCVFVGGLLVVAGYFLTKVDTLIASRQCAREEIGAERRESREPEEKKKSSKGKENKESIEEQLEKMMAYDPFAGGKK